MQLRAHRRSWQAGRCEYQDTTADPGGDRAAPRTSGLSLESLLAEMRIKAERDSQTVAPHRRETDAVDYGELSSRGGERGFDPGAKRAFAGTKPFGPRGLRFRMIRVIAVKKRVKSGRVGEDAHLRNASARWASCRALMSM